jgi:hypothetical protein
LGRHEDLLSKIDNAIRNAFGQRYDGLWEKAREFLQRFNAETGLQCRQKDSEEFRALVMRGEQTGGIPSEDQVDLLAQFLLPKIIDDFTDPQVIRKYSEWITTLSPQAEA